MFISTRRLVCCTRLALAATLLCLLCANSHLAAEEHVLFDFEQAGLGKDWTAQGKIEVARQPLPPLDDATPKNGPTGSGVLIRVGRAGGLYSKAGRIAADWRSRPRIRLWVYRSPSEADARRQSTMELQLLEDDPRARFWRKVVLYHRGWKQIDVPLREMRWGPGRVPRYDRIDKIGFWFRNPAEVVIDHVSFEQSDSPAATQFSLNDLRAVAFPDLPADKVFTTRRPSILLMTNEQNLDLQKLADHLEAVGQTIQKDLELKNQPEIPPTLILFSTRSQYEQFSPRFAKLLNSIVERPRSQGFTLHGISTSYWEPKIGSLRPVYTHEFVHSYLAHAALIQNQGGWFQEGLASYYQVRSHPQADLAKIILDGVDNPQHHLPLDQLTNGRRIPTNRYWQALTFVEMLLTRPEYRPKFPHLIAAFQKTGSTNLQAVSEEVYGEPISQLYKKWQEHCRERYGKDGTTAAE